MPASFVQLDIGEAIGRQCYRKDIFMKHSVWQHCSVKKITLFLGCQTKLASFGNIYSFSSNALLIYQHFTSNNEFILPTFLWGCEVLWALSNKDLNKLSNIAQEVYRKGRNWIQTPGVSVQCFTSRLFLLFIHSKFLTVGVQKNVNKLQKW